MAKRSATGEPPARGSSKLNLEDLLLENVEITRETIGSFSGTCGKVSKAYYYGSPCAAVEFHRSWTNTIFDSKAFDSKGNPKTPLTRSFMKECLRCTKLRHPNVVQFFGIYYEVPGSAGTLRGPVLIMEKMGETLNSYLTKNKSVEMARKLFILLDISQGLMYLHSRDPQIVHGGLTSHDVLLTDSPTPQAKITGNPNAVRILNTVRQQNKDLIEFLPHSIACSPCDSPKSTLDVFSYGGIMLHTLTQEWPKPTVYTYTATVRSSGGFKSSIEIERRSRHIKKVDNQILEQLIKSCLDDEASARPSISVVHKAVKNAVSHDHEEPAAAAATARSSTKASQKDKVDLKSKAKETVQHSEHRNQNTQQKDEIILEKNKEIELIKYKLQQKDEMIEQKSKEIEQKVHEKDEIIQRKSKEMEQIVQEIESKENIIQQRDEEIEKKVQECQQKDRKIEQKEKEIQRKNDLVEQKNVEIEHAHKQYQEIENQLRKLKLKQENSEPKLMDTSLSTKNESQHAETQILGSQSELQCKGTKTTEKEIEKEVQQMHQQDETEKFVKNQHLVNKSGQINNTANEKHLLNDRDAENETTKYKIKAAKPVEKPMDQNKKQVDLLPSVEKCKIDYLSDYVIANNAVSPVVSLNNIQGKPIINCGDNITVKLQANKISGVITLPVDVAELGNGQYKVSFTIKEAGDYKLVMCVGNQCIIHPPFRIHCIQWPQQAFECGSQMRIIKPLRNATSTTCYFNSVLQVLNQTSGFIEMLLKYNNYADRPYELYYEKKGTNERSRISIKLTGAEQHTLLFMVMLFFKEVEDVTSQVIQPDYVLNRLTVNSKQERFGQYTQEDSHELLRYLLYELKKEEIDLIKGGVYKHFETNAEYSSDPAIEKQDKLTIKSLLRTASKMNTPIDMVFGGVKVNTVICRECQTPSQTFEPFFDISVGIPDKKQKASYNGGCGRGYLKEYTGGSHWQSHQSHPGQSMYHGQAAYGHRDATYTTTKYGHQYGYGNKDIWEHCERTNMTPSHTSFRGEPRREGRKPEVLPLVYDKESVLMLLKSKDMFYQPVSDKFTSNIEALDDVQISLVEHTEIDNMDENNKFICKNCIESKGTMADTSVSNPKLCFVTKQILIHQLPQVLIIHFKRFDIGTYMVTKDSRPVSFSPILNMAPYCSDKCLEDFGDANGEIIYGLYGVIEHIGQSLQSGHYTAYVRRRPERQKKFESKPASNKAWIYDRKAAHDGVWCHASDLDIEECTWGIQMVKECKPYMLFYELLPWVTSKTVA